MQYNGVYGMDEDIIWQDDQLSQAWQRFTHCVQIFIVSTLYCRFMIKKDIQAQENIDGKMEKKLVALESVTEK